VKSFDRISRREALGGIATVGAVGIAGCSGGDGDSNAPDPDANPEDLLPEAPEGWEVDDEPQQQAAGMIGADAGFEQAFNAPSGNRYPVGAYRFSSEGDAEDSGPFWTAYVVRGNFTFPARGPDIDNVYQLLGNSPALTEEYARNNDMA
jgi:hypothetical protein